MIMKAKKIISVSLVSAMAMGLFAGCGGGGGSDSDVGQVYFLNFKPEVAEVWEQIAE